MSKFVIDPVWKCVNKGQYEKYWDSFRQEAERLGFVGLDLEWTSSRNEAEDTGKVTRISGPVATVQLSVGSKTIVLKYCDLEQLIQGTCQDPLLPLSTGWPHHREGVRKNAKELLYEVKQNTLQLLGDIHVKKVGVGIAGDKQKFESEYKDVRVENCVDLNALAEVAGYSLPFPCSLKDMAFTFAGMKLEKDYYVVTSNWGGFLGALSPKQIEYAAADAEASFRVAQCIFQGDEIDMSAVQSITSSMISKKQTKRKGSKEQNALARMCHGRKKPYYDNVFVYDSEGSLAFTVDKSKAEWYVGKKNLASVREWSGEGEDKQIKSIQLRFKPDFEKFNDAHIRRNMDYFRQPKDNQCVVCGNTESLVRFAIVPFTYRKHFPSVYMSHNSYDLILLCTTCFATARQQYDNEINNIASEFGIPSCIPSANQLHQYHESIFEDRSGQKEGMIPSTLRTKIMQEYFEVCRCREKLMLTFKFAKACLEEKSTIPPERLEEMGCLIAENMDYPFYDPDFSDMEEQMTAFSGGSLSDDALRFILHGSLQSTKQRNFRQVLSLYWFNSHPDLFRLMGATTRAREKERTTNSSELVSDLPFVDSHGFFIVRALMEKYSESVEKTAEHSVGEFILRWRRFFCETLHPSHMPNGWKVEDGVLV